MFLYLFFVTCLFFNTKASEVGHHFTYASSDSSSSNPSDALHDSDVFVQPSSSSSKATPRRSASQDELDPVMQRISPKRSMPSSRNQAVAKRLEPSPTAQPGTQPASPYNVTSPTYGLTSPIQPGTIPTTPVTLQPTGFKIHNPKAAKESEQLRAKLQSEKDDIVFAQKSNRIEQLLKRDLANDQVDRALTRTNNDRPGQAEAYINDKHFFNVFDRKQPVSAADINIEIDISPVEVLDTKRITLEYQSGQIESQISDFQSLPSNPDIQESIKTLKKELHFIHKKLVQHHHKLAQDTQLILESLERKFNRATDDFSKNKIRHIWRKSKIALDYHNAQQRMHQNTVSNLDQELGAFK